MTIDVTKGTVTQGEALLLSARQVAAKLNVSACVAQKLMASGKIKAVNMGSGQKRKHLGATEGDVLDYMVKRNQEETAKLKTKIEKTSRRVAKRPGPKAVSSNNGDGFGRKLRHLTEVVIALAQRLNSLDGTIAKLEATLADTGTKLDKLL